MRFRTHTAVAVCGVVGLAAAMTPAVAAKNQPTNAQGNYVVPLQPPDTSSGQTVTLQGVKGADQADSYYIVGTANPNGVVYEGPAIKGATTGSAGVWTTMNVPASWGADTTSIYGVDNLDGSNVALVGAYSSGNLLGSGNHSFYYEGPVTSTPDPANFKQFTAKDPRDQVPAEFTFLHSVSGGLVVGNYDFLDEAQAAGQAFIYDPATGDQIQIKYPKQDRALTHSAYGIWWNGGNSYTIAGGTGRGDNIVNGKDGRPIGDATLVDYNSKTGKFSHYTKFQYPSASKRTKGKLVTHFEGIWSNGKRTYRLPATVGNARSSAAIATVTRTSKGGFGPASWKSLHVRGAKVVTTNDSIYGKVSVGQALIDKVFTPYAFRQR